MDLDINSPADLLPGDVGFARIPGRVGGLIALGQGLIDVVDIVTPHPGAYAENLAIWTHAYMYLGEGLIYEAMPRGSAINPLAHRWGARWAYGRVPLSDEQRGRVMDVARRKVGTPYGFSDYAALAAWHLDLPGKDLLRDYVKSNEREICSQAVDAIWCELGFHLFQDGRLSQDCTPGSLYWQVSRKGRVYLTPN